MNDNRAQPWYRYPIMWLVVGGPVGAVIAGVITFALILAHPDPVIDTMHPAAQVLQGGTANPMAPPAD
jgi:membrane protein required for beta-lactamase induction